MANRGEHGGKRKGAGRKPKWSYNFKLHVGMLCQTQFREEQKMAEKRAIKDPFFSIDKSKPLLLHGQNFTNSLCIRTMAKVSSLQYSTRSE